jgi:hypothetical protein
MSRKRNLQWNEGIAYFATVISVTHNMLIK